MFRLCQLLQLSHDVVGSGWAVGMLIVQVVRVVYVRVVMVLGLHFVHVSGVSGEWETIDKATIDG